MSSYIDKKAHSPPKWWANIENVSLSTQKKQKTVLSSSRFYYPVSSLSFLCFSWFEDNGNFKKWHMLLELAELKLWRFLSVGVNRGTCSGISACSIGYKGPCNSWEHWYWTPNLWPKLLWINTNQHYRMLMLSVEPWPQNKEIFVWALIL